MIHRVLIVGALLPWQLACSHVVLIKTTPPGAVVAMDNEVLGVSPVFFEEATGFGREYKLRLSLEGYRTEYIQLQQDVWWHSCLWPSLCLIPVTVGVSGIGVLFARSLRDEYTFKLTRLPGRATPDRPPEQTGVQPGVEMPPAGTIP